VQGYDAAQLLGAGITLVRGDISRRDDIVLAMRKTIINSPRGKLAMSTAHNPVQDFYIREAKGKNNESVGIAVKALADPARGCKN
ncbi:MAG: ABC transporter permease, partial [Aquabacterium sp.]|nr:ABC transporter permease [Aquabacterium sp.]